jgi:hypothetical protein
MGDYIVLKMGRQQTIVGSRCVKCDNDSEAVSAAYAATYDVSPDCYAVEVWAHGRMVTRVLCPPEPRTRPTETPLSRF